MYVHLEIPVALGLLRNKARDLKPSRRQGQKAACSANSAALGQFKAPGPGRGGRWAGGAAETKELALADSEGNPRAEPYKASCSTDPWDCGTQAASRVGRGKQARGVCAALPMPGKFEGTQNRAFFGSLHVVALL